MTFDWHKSISDEVVFISKKKKLIVFWISKSVEYKLALEFGITLKKFKIVLSVIGVSYGKQSTNFSKFIKANSLHDILKKNE